MREKLIAAAIDKMSGLEFEGRQGASEVVDALLDVLRSPTLEMLQSTSHILSHFEGEDGEQNVYMNETWGLEEAFTAMIDSIRKGE